MTHTQLALAAVALTVTVILAVAIGALAALFARMDGASRPAAATRAGAAFGAALTVVTALLALAHDMLSS